MRFGHPPADPIPSTCCAAIPDADGSAGNDGVFFGLTPIESPFKRLLNGGNEIEFFRCLAVGEKCVANARYADVQLKQGKSGSLLFVVIETTISAPRRASCCWSTGRH